MLMEGILTGSASRFEKKEPTNTRGSDDPADPGSDAFGLKRLNRLLVLIRLINKVFYKC